jgi:hypothetical protein
MDLQSFIKETITQIAEAVVDIQDHFDKQKIDAIVNPREFQDIKDGKFAGRYKPTSYDSNIGSTVASNYHRVVDSVEFDVAVYVETDSKKGVGGKLKVLGASIGADGEKTDRQENVSKVKFKIPIVMPHGKKNN